jgi:branched-chain amino acid transport system substrate-binding protein
LLKLEILIHFFRTSILITQNGGNTMQQKKRLIFSAIIVFISLLMGYTATAATKKIKVGYSIPLNVSFGVEINRALKVAVPMLNKAGGITVKGERYDLEVKVLDDQYNADKARTNAERFIYQDGFKHIFYLGSVPVIAAFPVTEKAGALMLAGASTDKHLMPPSRYTFRSAEGPLAKAVKFKFVRDHFPNAKTIVLTEQDDEAGKADGRRVAKIAPYYNFKLLDTLYYPRGSKDFTSIATKIKSINPDIVVFAATEAGTAIGLQIKALRIAGYTGGVAKTEELNMKELKSVASNEQLEGLIGKVGPDLDPNVSQLFKDFKKNFIAEYGEWPTIYYGFLSALHMFKAAVEKADSLEVEDIAKAIEGGLEWETFSGGFMNIKRQDIGINRMAGCIAGASFGVVTNGKHVYEKSYSIQEVYRAASKVYGISR